MKAPAGAMLIAIVWFATPAFAQWGTFGRDQYHDALSPVSSEA
jgi:hypothetical protein